MIQINLLSPSSIILADLHQRPVFEKFLEAVLLAAGLEVKWDCTYVHGDDGLLHLESKTYGGVREVGPCTERPPMSEREEQQV